MKNTLKKITAALLITAASAAVTSCSKSEDIMQQSSAPDVSETVSETATGEPETRGTEATTTAITTTTTAKTTATTLPPVTTTTANPTTTPPPAVTTTAKSTAPPPVTTTTVTTKITTTPPVTTTTAVPAPLAPTEDMEEQVFRLVNQIREEYGLPVFKRLDALTGAAGKRAKEVSGFYSHTRPSGYASYTVLKEYGLNYSYAGENIAAGQRTAQVVVNDWMTSTKGHREAILSNEYQYMGVGFVRLQGSDPQGFGYYWVQEFFTPL